MDTLLIILICLAVAVAGELYVARHKNGPSGQLPEDVQ